MYYLMSTCFVLFKKAALFLCTWKLFKHAGFFHSIPLQIRKRKKDQRNKFLNSRSRRMKGHAGIKKPKKESLNPCCCWWWWSTWRRRRRRRPIGFLARNDGKRGERKKREFSISEILETFFFFFFIWFGCFSISNSFLLSFFYRKGNKAKKEFKCCYSCRYSVMARAWSRISPVRPSWN